MNKYIEAIAAREGISPMEVYEEIQKAIDLAWASADKKTRNAQLGLTGRLSPPTQEELIDAIIERSLLELA